MLKAFCNLSIFYITILPGLCFLGRHTGGCHSDTRIRNFPYDFATGQPDSIWHILKVLLRGWKNIGKNMQIKNNVYLLQQYSKSVPSTLSTLTPDLKCRLHLIRAEVDPRAAAVCASECDATERLIFQVAAQIRPHPAQCTRTHTVAFYKL